MNLVFPQRQAMFLNPMSNEEKNDIEFETNQ